MPRGWERLRALVLRRDHYACRVDLDDGRQCLEPAHEVDHVIPRARGGAHHPSNLRAICREHHAAKSAREGSAAAGGHGRRRPDPPHPGAVAPT